MLIPVLHRVIVKPDKAEDVNDVFQRAKAIGLELSIDKREQAAVETGIVISIGSTAFVDYGAKGIIEVGDKVYFAKYAGKHVKDGEEELLALNDEDIIAIIKEQE